MRRLRADLLCITLLTVVLACSLLGCDRGPSVEEYLTQAKQFEHKGELLSAAIALKNALQKEPDHAEARWRLGKAYFALGINSSAEKELKRAEALGFEEPDLAGLLIRLDLDRGRYQAVLDALASTESLEEAERLALMGRANLGLRNRDRARSLFDESLALDPNELDALLGLSQLVMGEAPEEAAEWAERAVTAHPESVVAWMVRGDAEMATSDYEAAAKAFTRATKVSPQHSVALFGYANALLGQGELEEVKAVIGKLKTLGLDAALIDFLAGVVAYQEGDLVEARSKLGQTLSRIPGHPGTLYLMGVISYRDQQPDRAETYLRRYVELRPRDLTGRQLLAQVQLQLGRPDLAVKTLNVAAGLNPDDAGLINQLGMAYMANGQAAEGRAYLAKSATLSKGSSADLQARIATGLIAVGMPAEGVEQFELAASQNPESDQTDVQLIYSYLHAKQTDKAFAAAQAFAKSNPELPLAENLLGLTSEALGDVSSAREHYLRAFQLDPAFVTAGLHVARLDLAAGAVDAAKATLAGIVQAENPGYLQAVQKLADIALAEGRLDEAKAGYQAVLDVEPNDPIALTQLATVVGRTDGYAAVELLERARSANPKSVHPRVTLAKIYVRTQPAKALEVAREAQALAPTDYRVLNVLGAAQWSSGETEAALETFRRVTDILPNSHDANLQLGVARLDVGDLEGAKMPLEKALELNPASNAARLELGRYHLFSGDLELAAATAQSVLDTEPGNPSAIGLIGLVHMERKDWDAAAKSFRTILEAQPNNSALRVELFRVLWSSGDKEAAYALLEGRLAEKPDDVVVRGALAGTYESVGNEQAALKQYELMLEHSPGNLIALNNIASLYLSAGDSSRALETATKAIELAPNSWHIADTYGWALVQNGSLEKGIAELRRALAMSPDAAELHYHLAVGLVKSGDLSGGRAEFEKALELGLKEPERSKAAKMLEEL